MNKSADIGRKSLGAVKWSVFTELVSRALSPLTFVVLARILAPQDFGIVAIAQVAISFCALFWDAGLEKALIQTREPLDKAANVVFWINVTLGLALYSVLFVTAPFLGVFFNTPAAVLVLQVLGLQIIIGSLTTVQHALFLRDFNFRQLFWAKLSTVAIPALVSIPMALMGYGVWALVASSLVAAVVNLLILWIRSSWRPIFSFDTAIAKKMASFGTWIVLDSFVGWFISQGDAVVVGRYLGVKDLGFYRTGRNIVDLLFGLILNPIYPILYPAFSALYEDKRALRDLLYKANRIIMAMTLPLGVGIMCISSPLVLVFLGDKWLGTEVVVSALGLQMAVGWLVAANPEIYRAMGRPDVQTKIGYMTLPLYLLVFFWAAPYGLAVFVTARFGLAILSVPIHVYMAVKILNLPYMYLWNTGKQMIYSTLIMMFSILGAQRLLGMSDFSSLAIVNLILSVFIGISSYLGALLILEKSIVLQVRDLVRKAIIT